MSMAKLTRSERVVSIAEMYGWAVALGKKGGEKTAEKGPEYYAEIQAKRKKRAGGRPPGPPKATHDGELPFEPQVADLC